MRKVSGSYLSRVNDRWEWTEFEGTLHGWGVDFEELGDNVGIFTTAIVELPGGQVVTPPASKIKFENSGVTEA